MEAEQGEELNDPQCDVCVADCLKGCNNLAMLRRFRCAHGDLPQPRNLLTV